MVTRADRQPDTVTWDKPMNGHTATDINTTHVQSIDLST